MRIPSPPPPSPSAPPAEGRDGGAAAASEPSPSPSPPTPTSWQSHKSRGTTHFQNGEYDLALASYRAALDPTLHCPDADRQVILSNVVAARLKIGSPAQIDAAVEDARSCVSINDRWSKGHVRLATALIATGGRSNDACNSLQTALSIDPGNSTARTMLLKELRRDHRAAASEAARRESGGGGGGGGGGAGTTEPGAPPTASPSRDDPSRVEPPNGTAAEAAPSSTPFDGDYVGSPTAAPPIPPPVPPPRRDDDRSDMDIDRSVPLVRRVQFRLARVAAWYQDALTEDARTLLKVALGLLALYVAFGGRFGLDAALGGGDDGGGNRGNYERGNAYDRYYGRGGGREAEYHGYSAGGYNDRYNPNNAEYYSGRGRERPRRTSPSSYDSAPRSRRATYEDDYYAPPPRARDAGSSSRSFHLPNLFDGSVPSILCLMAFAYLCHRNGINPFQALWMLNVFTGNRGRGRGMRHMGMAGMGYGMYRGMNGGMARRGGGRGRYGW